MPWSPRSLTENYVGHETHTPLTDPWHDREWDRRKSLAEENVKWLERHRAYLLQTQMQHVLPQTRPGFPEGRTIVVWSLAKFMSMLWWIARGVELTPDG
jgi:membrane-associated phospholipid phosphatase